MLSIYGYLNDDSWLSIKWMIEVLFSHHRRRGHQPLVTSWQTHIHTRVKMWKRKKRHFSQGETDSFRRLILAQSHQVFHVFSPHVALHWKRDLWRRSHLPSFWARVPRTAENWVHKRNEGGGEENLLLFFRLTLFAFRKSFRISLFLAFHLSALFTGPTDSVSHHN